jgi:hypothetical protein
VATKPECEPVSANFFYAINVCLDRINLGVERHMKVFLGSRDGAKQIGFIGAAAHFKLVRGHGPLLLE